jgi:hypothetical protein
VLPRDWNRKICQRHPSVSKTANLRLASRPMLVGCACAVNSCTRSLVVKALAPHSRSPSRWLSWGFCGLRCRRLFCSYGQGPDHSRIRQLAALATVCRPRCARRLAVSSAREAVLWKLASGVLWGLTAIAGHAYFAAPFDTFTFLIIAGMAAGATSTLSALRGAGVAFIIGTLVPAAVSSFLDRVKAA